MSDWHRVILLRKSERRYCSEVNESTMTLVIVHTDIISVEFEPKTMKPSHHTHGRDDHLRVAQQFRFPVLRFGTAVPSANRLPHLDPIRCEPSRPRVVMASDGHAKKPPREGAQSGNPEPCTAAIFLLSSPAFPLSRIRLRQFGYENDHLRFPVFERNCCSRRPRFQLREDR